MQHVARTGDRRLDGVQVAYVPFDDIEAFVRCRQMRA